MIIDKDIILWRWHTRTQNQERESFEGQMINN